jgi:hypothetical protein
MNKQTSTSLIEQTIATALGNPSVTSVELAELIPETEAALTAAEATAQAERKKALDPIASADTAEAEKVVWAAEFRCDRLRSFLSQLRQRVAEIEAAEYDARWQAEFEAVKAERDAVAKELGERYPKLTADLCDLFRRALAIDQECSRVDGTAPAGESRRLRGVERTARGLDFSFYKPALTDVVKLPEWKDSGRLAWPPPKTPLGALFAAAMTPPHDPRFSADWAAAREQDRARRATGEAHRAEEEAARRVPSRKAYEASQRR